MLDRIKKRQFDGFKEFVINMETTGTNSRQQIFLAGILEDPVYMTYVMKNLYTFENFLDLPSDEIDSVLKLQEQMLGVLAKSIFGSPEDQISQLGSIIPKYISKLKDELSYLKEVTPSEKEGARNYILKVVRKLQQQETIRGFPWKMPPQDLFYPKVFKDGRAQLFFESGVLAAEGNIVKGKRSGQWKHFYDTGKILGEGEYVEGHKLGIWIFYFGNGNLKAKGKFKVDQRQGTWKEWDRAGNETEVEYKEGVKQA